MEANLYSISMGTDGRLRNPAVMTKHARSVVKSNTAPLELVQSETIPVQELFKGI